MSAAFGTPFEPTKANEYVCSTWFERDRQNIRLETPKGRVVFDLWDEAVTDAIESGYLRVPRPPRLTDADWLPCAVNYAVDIGLLKKPLP